MLIVVTNRHLCRDDFLKRFDSIASCCPNRIILREKDLSKNQYKILALRCKEICDKYGVKLVVNSFVDIARELKIRSVHVGFDMFINTQEWIDFDEIGVSVHSVEEARKLNNTKATYIVAGHIFDTDCKKDLPPRGLEFLRRVCLASELPVWGIGGINAKKKPSVIDSGAVGVCVMSEMMVCDNVQDVIKQYYDNICE